jgi:hypothetical protein
MHSLRLTFAWPAASHLEEETTTCRSQSTSGGSSSSSDLNAHLVLHIAECHQRQHLIHHSVNFTRTCTQVHTLATRCSPAAAAAAAAELQEAAAAPARAAGAAAVG